MKKFVSLLLAFVILLSAMPLNVFAAEPVAGDEPTFEIRNYDQIKNDKEKYLNNGDVVPAELGDAADKDAANEQIAGPEKDELQTVTVNYKTKIDKLMISAFQPYVASVFKNGKMTVNDTVDLPAIDGYTTPTPRYTISRYNMNNKWHSLTKDYIYETTETDVKIVDKFQDLKNPNVFNPKSATPRTERGTVGNQARFTPLPERETPGFSPENSSVEVQVPENSKNFEIEMRYFRNAYEIKYDTDGGSEIRTKKLYFEQNIPNVEAPTKDGATFKGWIADRDLIKNDGATVAKGTIISNDKMEEVKVPAHNVLFTAKWEEAKEAGYTVLFWTEKSDYDESATELRDKYDYVGLKKVEKGKVGEVADLSTLDPSGLKFPDLDQSVTSDAEELAKYYHRNEELTRTRNEKITINSTGKTVYNIYYDRNVYELVFEKHTSTSNSFDPIIEKNGKTYDATTNPYTVRVRLHQRTFSLSNDDKSLYRKGKILSKSGWPMAQG